MGISMTYIYCPLCDAEYSSTPGDYWNQPTDYVFTCCDSNCWLVERGSRFEGDKILEHTVSVAKLEERKFYGK